MGNINFSVCWFYCKEKNKVIKKINSHKTILQGDWMDGALCDRGLVPPMKQHSFIFHCFLNIRKKEHWKLHANFQGTSTQQQLQWHSQTTEACETLINAPDKISNCFTHQKCRHCSAISCFFWDREAGKHNPLFSPLKYDQAQFPFFLFESKSFSTYWGDNLQWHRGPK